GIYYIISRSLGPEFGASVGIIFAFANAVAASMNTIGFCDSLNELLQSQGLKIIDNSINDVRIVGAVALLVIYAAMVLISGGGALRDASGNVTDLIVMNGTVMNHMPRLIQALGIDRIYPGLIFFSKPYGKHGEPYRGYVLTFIVSLLFLLIGELNTIAPLISNFYLASYALINFCTFHAALYYNVWVSLLGFLLCVAIMLLISWVMSLITFAIFFTLYLIVHYRHPGKTNLDLIFIFETGARALMQSTGVGRLAPNVLLMGYKSDWTTAPTNDLVSYFNVLHTAFETKLAVAILRVSGGLDYGCVTSEEVPSGLSDLTATSSGSADLRVRRTTQIMHADSDLDIHLLTLTTSRSFTISEKSDTKEKKKDKKGTDIHRQIVYKSSSGIELSMDQLSQMTLFQKKKDGGTLDVWWLYDDGGLTILLPYIISQRSTWANCKLRVFALANRNSEMELEERKTSQKPQKPRPRSCSMTQSESLQKKPWDQSNRTGNASREDQPSAETSRVAARKFKRRTISRHVTSNAKKGLGVSTALYVMVGDDEPRSTAHALRAREPHFCTYLLLIVFNTYNIYTHCIIDTTNASEYL
ncbi:unnamed protein product, partial [Leptidea sinapis]